TWPRCADHGKEGGSTSPGRRSKAHRASVDSSSNRSVPNRPLPSNSITRDVAHTRRATPCSAFPACQTQQTTLTTIGQGQNPLKTSTPEAAYSGRNSHSMSCWGCTARAPRRAPTTTHTDLTGAPTGPTACPPPQEGNRPSCPTPDLRPLAATSSAPGSERAEWEPCGVPGTPPYAVTWPSKKSSCPPG